MLRRRLPSVGCLIVACGFLAHGGFGPRAMAAPPNVLIFYADDLGYGETGSYGCKEIPTPHIDALARDGVRFTQGYVAATYCSPSRAGLMTGRYPTRFGHEFNAVARQTGLSLKETTIADRLRALDYATCAIGKWHLGGQASKEYYATNRGFDEFFGTLNNTPFFHPTFFVDSRKSLDVVPITDDAFYTTEKYAERAVDWIDRNKDRHWFLYLPFNAQHAPLQAPQEYLDRFPQIADEKRRTFAAMMSAMDDAIGQVMAKVRELGQEERTLVFFISDNGGPTKATTSRNGALRGFKMTTFEGGTRVPFIAQWKGVWPRGVTYDQPALNLDVLPTCLAAAGSPIGADARLDGVDLGPYLVGAKQGRPHEDLFWRFGKQWAVRSGDWKLVVAQGGSGKPELYDLTEDVSESEDLAAKYPDRVADLQRRYDAWNAEQAPPSAVDTPNRNRARSNTRKTPPAKTADREPDRS